MGHFGGHGKRCFYVSNRSPSLRHCRSRSGGEYWGSLVNFFWWWTFDPLFPFLLERENESDSFHNDLIWLGSIWTSQFRIRSKVPTIQQLIRNTRQPIANGTKSPALRGCPQRGGVCTRVYVRLVRIKSWNRLGDPYSRITLLLQQVQIYNLLLWGMIFMVSIGANPITLMWDEKQFLIGSEWLSIHWAGKIVQIEEAIMLILPQERTDKVSCLANPHNSMSSLYG